MVLGLAGLLTALLALGVVFAVLAAGGQDPAGRGMLAGMAAAAVLYWAVGILPAMLVLRRGNRVGLALSLLLAPVLILTLLAIFT
jgi:hypothetical protein